MDFIQLIMDHLDWIIVFIVGAVTTYGFKKKMTPEQIKEALAIGNELKDIIERTKALIISIETDPVKEHIKVNSSIKTGELIDGNFKHDVAVRHIVEKFPISDQNRILSKFGSIGEFVKHVYTIAKPLVGIVRLVKGSK